MRNNNIAEMLDGLAETGQVLERLVRMPRSRLENILALLSDPLAVRNLSRLLRYVREAQTGARPFPTRVPNSAEATPDDLTKVLRQAFSDRERFPSVASIAQFAREIFKVNIEPKKQEGRDRFAGRVCKLLQSDEKALENARNVMAHADPRSERDRAYASLYNFIRGRLTE